MVADTVGNHPREMPDFPIVARAICQFGRSNSVRLYVSELTESGAFILAMRPLRIGEPLTVTLYPLVSAPLPPLEARVIGVRIDPSDASRTGFEVVFSSLDDSLCARLAEAVDAIEQCRPARHSAPARRGAERRVYPRVAVDLKAHVELPDGETVTLSVHNISMSGAMLLFGNKQAPAAIAEGSRFNIHFLSSGPPEHICINAEVVRSSRANEPSGVGVRFIETDEMTLRRLEGLILDALTGPSSWLHCSDADGS
jgi:hypothetical protein